MEKIKIDGLYEAAKRAYSGISFDPEKRAISIVEDYENELNTHLQIMPEGERERYTENYKKHLFSWLSAKSRCLSPMITGPSNFPTRRNEKANNAEHRRLEEFVEWREKAMKSIMQRMQDARPQEDKDAERWERIKKTILSSAETIIGIDKGTVRGSSRPLFVSSITGFITRMANNGDAVMVGRCLELIDEINNGDGMIKPIITKNNAIWKLLDQAVDNKKKSEEISTRENSEIVKNGVRVVQNWKEDRLQLFFDGKPSPEMITKLRKAAFKWSPSRGCWQRQNTNNAISAMQAILK